MMRGCGFGFIGIAEVQAVEGVGQTMLVVLTEEASRISRNRLIP